MKIEGKNVILEYEKDYEFIKLISHITKMKYGEIEIRIKDSKPYLVVEIQKSILLTKEGA